MKNSVVLGIDTSNYTTSVAVMTLDGKLLANVKRPLPVKNGERGLRQSDAVFAHVKNLPSAMQEAREAISGRDIAALSVSERPRNLDGSYMPCFLAGVSAAEAVASAMNIPLYKFSHQCGHVMAAIYSAKAFDLLESEFAAFHISGGTTELLRVRTADCGFSAEQVGGTRDLNAGQVIDRIGVAMGLKFPCGPALEALAKENTVKIPKKKISRDGFFVNLSGLENMALDLLRKTEDKSHTAAFVFDYIGNAIAELSRAYLEAYGDTHFIYAGGVMCNSIIKSKLAQSFECSFAEPSMSADNAVGIAYLGVREFNKK